jgi:hypothetical protein
MSTSNELTQHETELLARLAPAIDRGAIRIELDASRYWDWLNETFPFTGNKIARRKVAWLVEYSDWSSRFPTARALFEHACAQPQVQGAEELTVVDDGIVSFAITGSKEALAGCMDELRSSMLHIYCIAPERRLCFCITLEGDAFLCGV